MKIAIRSAKPCRCFIALQKLAIDGLWTTYLVSDDVVGDGLFHSFPVNEFSVVISPIVLDVCILASTTLASMDTTSS